MKFNIMLLFVLTITTVLFAQNAPIDFEAGGFGSDWTWTVFENVTNPPLDILANPDATGSNTSATVAKFTALQAGAPWAGCESLHGTDIGMFNLNASNSTIKIMVYKPVMSDVGIKLVKPDSWSMGEIKVANTVVNEWEELTFDFTAQITDGYDQIVIFPDFDLNGRTQDNICYFDNITFHSQTAPVEPEAAAPTPNELAENVISLFSNPYTDVMVDTWSAEWDMADVADIQIEGNDTKLYTNLSYAGIEFTSQTIDASSMTHFHLDIWTPDNTSSPAVLKVKLVDFGADGVYDGGDDSEDELIFDESILDSEVWVSLDIPLSNFAGLMSTEHLAQLIISGDPNTVYMDNVYFYTENSDAEENVVNSVNSPYILGSNYPNPFNPTTTISFTLKSSGYVTLSIYDVKGRLVETIVQTELAPNTYREFWNAENVASGIYFYRLSVNGQKIDTKRMVLIK